MCELPLRQYSQTPSPWLNGTSTRSPFLKLWVSLPTSSTTPQNSCPITSGIGGTNPIHAQSPDQACQSDRQTPSASVRTMTPLAGHFGSATSLTTSGLRTASITAAFIAQSPRFVCPRGNSFAFRRLLRSPPKRRQFELSYSALT